MKRLEIFSLVENENELTGKVLPFFKWGQAVYIF